MTSHEKSGTFWVIEGVKVKKKQPFTVSQIPRIIQDIPSKPPKMEHQESQHLNPTQSITARNFFTDKSFQNLGDRKVDYGVLRISSLDELRGGQLFGLCKEVSGSGNFTPYENEIVKPQQKYSIFVNEFIGFNYISQESEQYPQNSCKMFL